MAGPTQAKLTSPNGVLTGDTYPYPIFTFEDEDGTASDLTDYTVAIEYTRETSETFTIDGTIDGSDVSFPWGATDTDTAGVLDPLLKMTNTVDASVYSLIAEAVVIYDLSTLWCSPSDVLAIVGDGYDQWDVLQAILVAEAVVRAWVTRPVGSPVPDRVRQATAILAARVLTTAPGAGAITGDGEIIEERIADYTVKYSEGVSLGSVYIIDEDVKTLLLPWHPAAYQLDIGEADSTDTDDFYETETA